MRRSNSRSEASTPPGDSDPARIFGFDPVAGRDARVLILGSMPSVASLDKQQYYGLPRNAFWPIMASLFGVPADRPYQERLTALVEHKIALWDVIRSCCRPGSLDSSIATDSVEPNDFKQFFQVHTGIGHVFFNGQKAEDMFNRLVRPNCPEAALRSFTRLPSTSPAHAAMNFEEKLIRWTAVRAECGPAEREIQ